MHKPRSFRRIVPLIALAIAGAGCGGGGATARDAGPADLGGTDGEVLVDGGEVDGGGADGGNVDGGNVDGGNVDGGGTVRGVNAMGIVAGGTVSMSARYRLVSTTTFGGSTGGSPASSQYVLREGVVGSGEAP